METNETPEPLPVVIAADQQAIIGMAEHAIEAHPRYTLAGVTANAAMATQLATHVKPALVVLAECLPGSTTNDAVAYLHQQVPTCEVIVVVVDGKNMRQVDLIENIFAGVGLDETDLFARALDSVAEFLDGNAELEAPDRRLRSESRARQDWQAVTAERRSTGRRETDHDLAATEF